MEKHQEHQYLDIMRDILTNGKDHENRTGIKTKRLICETMKFDLSEEFPLLTTKKVYWKGVVHELLWFLSGTTDSTYLKENNVKIWEGNSKEYCKQLGLDEDNGYVGKIYGYQWRNFNGQNCDQIKNAIEQIKHNPESRRIIVSAWNPLQMNEMCLPPCHVMFQFTVDEDRLHCTLYQRSCDFFLGIPFNIASYALLTCMVAQVCGLKPGVFNHVMNDVHLYDNHIEQANKQLTREPYKFPTIKLNKDVKDIDSFQFEDIELLNYHSHSVIKGEMAV